VNELDVKQRLRDQTRWALTLTLGMMVLFWRIVIPTNVEITTATVILTASLDLLLTIAVIFINKNELKEAFFKKFTWKDVLKTIGFFVVAYLTTNIFAQIMGIIRIDATFNEIMANNQNAAWLAEVTAHIKPSPADWVAGNYIAVFPLGAFISMAILAPVWEEIVFRMAGRNLFKNPVLYVVVTACLFAFIHTVNFSIFDNATYFFFGVLYAVGYLIFKDVRIFIITHFINNLIATLLVY